MTLAVLDVDLAAGEGARLLAAVRQADPRLAAAAALLRQTFLIRSPWAPGLRFVGALASRGEATFSVGGAGLSVEDAFMSCLGEAAERMSQIEQPGDLLAADARHAAKISPATARLCALVSPRYDLAHIDWVPGSDLCGAPSATAADWCLRRPSYGSMRLPGTMLSTGCAAGRDIRDASARAMLELVERDAAALWWAGAQEASSIDMDDDTLQLLRTLREDEDRRHAWLLDISTDLGIPVVAALSCDSQGRDLVIGLGARGDAPGARRKAILELCQMEIGLQLARLKPQARCADDDRRHLARAAMAIGDARLQARAGRRTAAFHREGRNAFDTVTEALHTHGIDVTLVDLTRADIGIPVIKAVAPDLQPSPGSIHTERLKRRLRPGNRLPDVPLH